MTCDDIIRICDFIDTAHPPEPGIYYYHVGKTAPQRDLIIVKKHFITDKSAGLFRVIVSLAVRRIEGNTPDGKKKVTKLSHKEFEGFFSLTEELFGNQEVETDCLQPTVAG